MKQITTIVTAAFVLIMLQSCSNKDLLNVKNPNAYNPEDVWRDEKLANAYVVDLYSTLAGWPVNQGDYADESSGLLTQDYVSPANTNMKYWPYTPIRRINILLNEIDGGTLPKTTRDILKGQVHFLRAYHYFKAVVYHGGVPIIKVPQLLNDSLSVPRNTTKECFDFIIQELDSAIGVLPLRYTGDNYGRIDKSIATAFKGRVLLYKASPQFNPSNPYDNTYWQEAYTANSAAKTLLEGAGFALFPDYGGIWMNEQNLEDVMSVIYKNPGKLNGRQDHCVRPLSQSKNCTGADNPIWALVASYPMLDGKQPGASSKYIYDISTFWQNRDPRFNATIAYNGSIFPLGVSADRRQYTDLQVGGLDDGFGPGQTFNRTGFYTRKGIDNSLAQAQVELNSVDWVEIRFAEVLFNYAEAANETGHTDEALAVLKKIRQRAGIEAGADNMFGLAAGMSRTAMRDAIYAEKYIEFTFEGKRFWDLRRARRLSLLNGAHKFGLLATLKPGLDPRDKTKVFLSTDFNYTATELIRTGLKEVSTPDTYYFFPLAQDEMQKNPKLQQNAAWGGSFDPTLH
ncbi:MAG: RagB/SusD family nutrient uptake outer membrane protein [Chitinophagaceae bacterium]